MALRAITLITMLTLSAAGCPAPSRDRSANQSSKARPGPTACFKAPVRILPLGDSITQGRFDLQSYRYPLWKKLVTAGVKFDFVGSMKTNLRGNPTFAPFRGKAFDPDHEGHWGWKADQILSKLPGWLEKYTPDIVLLHLGHNDMFKRETPESTLSELGRIIAALRRDNPDVKVLMARLIPVHYRGANKRIGSLNAVLEAFARKTSTRRSPVTIVDHAAGFDVETDLSPDRIHPNNLGEKKMAQKWFVAIRTILKTQPVCP